MTEPERTDDEPADTPEPDPGPPPRRRYPSTIGGAFYLLILGAFVVGIWLAHFSDDWRVGVRVVGAALGAAAALRLVLPARDAGMLAVRHRLVDVVMLAAVGATLVFLAGDIPDQPA